MAATVVAPGVLWPDEVDDVIGGDLTAALAYLTPAGGAVVAGVAPLGVRDREKGVLSFTTSLGFPKKLQRLVQNRRWRSPSTLASTAAPPARRSCCSRAERR